MALIGRLIAAVIFVIIAGIFYTQFSESHMRTWQEIQAAVGWGERNREVNTLYQDPGYSAKRTADGESDSDG